MSKTVSFIFEKVETPKITDRVFFNFEFEPLKQDLVEKGVPNCERGKSFL